MKNLASLLTWAFLASAGIPNALASSAYTCATFAEPSARYTEFTGINNKGQVIGIWSGSDQVTHAFLRNPDGSITPLASPSGSDEFDPIEINNLRQILGRDGTRTFILNADGSYQELAPPVAPPGHTYNYSYFSESTIKANSREPLPPTSTVTTGRSWFSFEVRTALTKSSIGRAPARSRPRSPLVQSIVPIRS